MNKLTPSVHLNFAKLTNNVGMEIDLDNSRGVHEHEAYPIVKFSSNSFQLQRAVIHTFTW